MYVLATDKSKLIGYFYLFIYIISIPMGSLITSNVGKSVNVFTLIFISTLWCIVFFHLVNLGKNLIYYKKILSDVKRYFLIQLTVMLMWGGTFILPIYYSPFIELFSYFSLGALIGFWIQYKDHKNINNLRPLLLTAILIFAFCYQLFSNYSLISSILCLVIIILTAIGGWFYKTASYASKDLVPSTFILASRFYGLFLLALIGIFYSKTKLPDLNQFIQIMIAASINLVLPIYCAQKSIRILSPVKHSILSALAPFLVLTLEMIIQAKMPDLKNLTFSIMLVVILSVNSNRK